jgi:hypothetical protein
MNLDKHMKNITNIFLNYHPIEANKEIMSITCLYLVRFFDGIVELAVHTASVRDPQNLALHYYESGQPEQPGLGYDAFLKRYVRFLSSKTLLTQTYLRCPP